MISSATNVGSFGGPFAKSVGQDGPKQLMLGRRKSLHNYNVTQEKQLEGCSAKGAYE